MAANNHPINHLIDQKLGGIKAEQYKWENTKPEKFTEEYGWIADGNRQVFWRYIDDVMHLLKTTWSDLKPTSSWPIVRYALRRARIDIKGEDWDPVQSEMVAKRYAADFDNLILELYLPETRAALAQLSQPSQPPAPQPPQTPASPYKAAWKQQLERKKIIDKIDDYISKANDIIKKCGKAAGTLGIKDLSLKSLFNFIKSKDKKGNYDEAIRYLIDADELLQLITQPDLKQLYAKKIARLRERIPNYAIPPPPPQPQQQSPAQPNITLEEIQSIVDERLGKLLVDKAVRESRQKQKDQGE